MSMVKQLIGQVRARVNFTTIKCIMSQGVFSFSFQAPCSNLCAAYRMASNVDLRDFPTLSQMPAQILSNIGSTGLLLQGAPSLKWQH